ncbi:MAG: DNA mismatch repair protein MutS [Dysgonamonadaceae bacterium]|jgi:DNA mismatch repair protein MutS|nr:DNA mismatch repair protein MutS [Dysgonamonadaceae bacterium]
MKTRIVETPLMKQYIEMKSQHPDAILLFRVGDFYETFSDDAIVASEVLGITLTRRANGAARYVELAGFPHHALDVYLPKLIRAKKRVAICDQLEDPKMTKKLVKRGITELVTPGVSINDQVLNHKENNFLAALHSHKNGCGIAFFDISTGEFLVAEGPANYMDKLLHNFMPKEILLERRHRRWFDETFGGKWLTFEMDDWIFTEDTARERLLKQFQTESLKGFGIQHLVQGIVAAGAILHYLDLTQHTQPNHITTIARIEEDRFVRLDRFTVRSLELLETMNEGGKTLLDVLDKTITPMGARLLKRWIVFPLKAPQPIEDRLSVVAYLTRDAEVRAGLEQSLNTVGDLERIISKAAVGRVNPREVAQLKEALNALVPIRKACVESGEPCLKSIGEQLDPCTAIRDRIQQELTPDPPLLLSKGHVIAQGVDAELDELRQISADGKKYLLRIQQREIEKTGIASLKISYNNVFGYYIEVRNTYKDKVPPGWIRKQTLVGAERYITEELKAYEEKILGAEDKILALEMQRFNDLVAGLSRFIVPIQADAALVAQIDCLLSFSKVAKHNKYVRPQINGGNAIDIKNGRHPVIETQLPPGEPYIPNDVYLDDQAQQIIMITGPNMAGKSALLRQTALITLMAQIGSFVPARSAHIGWVDKIFTRVGASDNISLGESTFMVEMNEAADILNNLSERSLILFDELGRGTSTYDGISIAWAIVEHIHEHPRGRAKTLFATHYHELNEMEKSFRRIKNYHISVKEQDNKIIFLRKLAKGGSEHSFGIHVAKLAGMPPSIVKRGNEILSELESGNRKNRITKNMHQVSTQREGYQMSLFQLADPVLADIRDELKDLDINTLTPLEALNKLSEIQRIAGEA